MVPTISIHPNYLVVTERAEFIGVRKSHNSVVDSNLKRNSTRNIISASASKKIKKAVNYLLLNAEGKVNRSQLNFSSQKFHVAFITLTLSAIQMHSDNYIKKYMLNQFIIELIAHYHVTNYIWRSERQANGNVHFHLLIDVFIAWQGIREIWNRIQLKEGYIAAYRKEQQEFHRNGFKPRPELYEKWSRKQQLIAYKQGLLTNWRNPNSTDIHGLRFIRNVGSYICKYMSKNEKANHEVVSAQIINHRKKVVKGMHTLSINCMKELRKLAEVGRLWACSRSLSDLKGGSEVLCNELKSELAIINGCREVRKIFERYYSIFFIDIKKLIELHCVKLIQLLSEFMCERFILKSG